MDKFIFIIIVAFILDSIIGDPQNPLHPIRFIGNGIYFGINLYKKIGIKNHRFSFVYGVLLSVVIILLSYFLTYEFIILGYRVHKYFGIFIEIILCYFIIAPKALKTESMKVYKDLKDENIEKARVSLSYIVGRDTNNLNKSQLIKGTVETIAENLSDGVIAPLFFIFIGGVPLGFAYKAVNTLDSTMGYRNETFEYLGKFPAKLDDLANFIPARLSALLMIVATICTTKNTKRACFIFKRDRFNHKSPNSAQTESVCAGALGIQLGGDNYYKGILVSKPTIGDNTREPVVYDIVLVNRLMYGTTIICMVIMVVVAIVRNLYV